MKTHSTLRDRVRTGGPDNFQTPPIALQPIIPLLHRAGCLVIWEPACGKGNLVRGLIEARPTFPVVIGTDIEPNQFCGNASVDFLRPDKYPFHFDAVVTNPPFTLKDQFLRRCYEIGKPFALLMPISALGGRRRQRMYREHGIEVVLLGERIDFETPSGNLVKDGAWFECAWFTWGLHLGSALTFATLERESAQLRLEIEGYEPTYTA